MVGPGSGKSTFAADLFAQMKKQNYKVELVTEFAKDCVYEKQFDILKTDQLYILANQNRRIQRIIESNEHIDYIITDSPLLLSIIYGKINNYFFSSDTFNNMCHSLFNQYNNINILLDRTSIKFDPDGRVQKTEDEAIKIDSLIKNLLDSFGYNYFSLKNRKITSKLIHYLINNNKQIF